MDWYPWYPEDFRHDTLHLTLAEDGAYRQLIDEYMLRRGPLPDDDGALARVLGVSRDEWLAVAPAVRKFFRPKEGELHHKRCCAELRAQDARFKRHSERGKKAAFSKYSRPNGLNARSMLAPTTLTLSKNTSLTSTESDAEKEAAEKRPSAAVSESLEENIRRRGWAP